jgi:hypothetical protein
VNVQGRAGPRKTAVAFREALRASSVSEQTLRAIEDAVKSRAASRARVPTL